ncbi:MAG: hypothetical protein PHO37_00425 [Kiritimatiellae bacterium]|nr:hypothetical protein [Kiritimatiellia bacterium]
MRFTAFVLSSIAALCLLACPVSAADTVSERAPSHPVYTNVAGQVIAGPVSVVTNGCVSFAGRQYPLKIFSQAEQARMLKDCGQALPARNTATERRDLFYRNLLDRQDALEKAGSTTPEKAKAQRALIRRAWSEGR